MMMLTGSIIRFCFAATALTAPLPLTLKHFCQARLGRCCPSGSGLMPVAMSISATPNAALLTALGLCLQVKKRDGVTGYDWVGFRLLMTHFWHRLVGSAGVWFCNDWVSLQAPSTCTVQAALPAAAGSHQTLSSCVLYYCGHLASAVLLWQWRLPIHVRWHPDRPQGLRASELVLLLDQQRRPGEGHGVSMGRGYGPCPVLISGATYARCSSLCLSYTAAIIAGTL